MRGDILDKKAKREMSGNKGGTYEKEIISFMTADFLRLAAVLNTAPTEAWSSNPLTICN